MPFTQTNLRPNGLFAGVAADTNSTPCESYVNAEASQELPFGTMAVQGTGDSDAKVFASNANKMIGIVRNHFAYAQTNGPAYGGDIGTIGVKPKVSVQAAQRGKMTVVVGEAVTPNSPVRVRATTNAGALGTALGPGTFCTTASAGHTVRCPFMRFTTSTTGAGVAEVAFDMNMRDTAVND
jgi:hypothetical protein